MERAHRLLVVLILGFSSGLPLLLVGSTLQAWFADTGRSVMTTGLLSLLGAPYLLSLFFSPILDRYSLFAMGKRRSWMLTMQVLLCVSFNLMAWFSPLEHATLIVMLAFLAACCSALQDIAINAYRTESLPHTEHGLGASITVMGYRLAVLVSGGVALVMAQRLGWTVTYRVMGGLMVVGMLAVVLGLEPEHPKLEQLGFKASFVQPFMDLFASQHAATLILFIFFFKMGEAFTTNTSGIVMPFLIQGLGFSLETIGYVSNVIGVLALLLGGVLAGLLLLRWPLYHALMLFGLLQALTNILFVVLAYVGPSIPLFVAAVVSDNFAAGLGTTGLVALIMRCVDLRFTGTQFTVLVAFSSLPRVLSGPIAGLLQSWLDWTGLYLLSVGLALLFIPLLYRLRLLIN